MALFLCGSFNITEILLVIIHKSSPPKHLSTPGINMPPDEYSFASWIKRMTVFNFKFDRKSIVQCESLISQTI